MCSLDVNLDTACRPAHDLQQLRMKIKKNATVEPGKGTVSPLASQPDLFCSSLLYTSQTEIQSSAAHEIRNFWRKNK